MPADTIHIPPLQRDALLAMLRAPTGMLVRRGRMFAASGRQPATSGHHQVQEFTRRLVLMLDREGLVHLDDDQFPAQVTLNAHGKQIAQRLAESRGATGVRTRADGAGTPCSHRGCTQTDGKPCAYAQCPNREPQS